MATSTLKKGRAVARAERPVYDALAERLLNGDIFFFSVPARGTWEIWSDGPGAADTAHSRALGRPDLVLDDAGAAEFVGLAARPTNRTVFAVKADELAGLDADLVKHHLAAALADLRATAARAGMSIAA